MTTRSRPAVGNQGFTETDWLNYFDAGDGIVDDKMPGGVLGFTLQRINSGNVARIVASPAGARVNGYRLEVTADHDLVIPTTAGTYRILVKYDPAANVADGGGNATAIGPCSLVVESGTPTTAGGEKYLHLYTIGRAASQNLTDTTLYDVRRWVGGLPKSKGASAASPSTGETLDSRGTLQYARDPNGPGDWLLVNDINEAGNALEWKEVGARKQENGGEDLPIHSALAAQDVSPLYYMGPNRHVYLRGTIKRASGNKLGTASDVLLGTLPVGYRPAQRFRCLVFTSGNAEGHARLWIEDTGQMILKPQLSAPDVDWISLDGIVFQAFMP